MGKELICVICGPVLPIGKEATKPNKQQVQKQESPKKSKNLAPHFEQNVLEKKSETDEFYNIENSLKTIVTEKGNSVENKQNNVKSDEKPMKKDSDSYDGKITDKATTQASPVS